MTVVFPDPFVSQQSMAQRVFGGLAYGFVFNGTHLNRSGPALDGNEELEASSLCWKSLDLGALLADLYEACQGRTPRVLSPLLGVHVGADSNSLCKTHPSESSPRRIDVSGSLS